MEERMRIRAADWSARRASDAAESGGDEGMGKKTETDEEGE